MIPEVIDGVATGIVLLFICGAVAITQFFFCWKFDDYFIKPIPTIVNLGLIILFFVLFNIFGDFWAVTWIFSMIALAADVLGWIIWAIWRAIRNVEPHNPTGY